jgi:hypothetical protein
MQAETVKKIALYGGLAVGGIFVVKLIAEQMKDVENMFEGGGGGADTNDVEKRPDQGAYPTNSGHKTAIGGLVHDVAEAPAEILDAIMGPLGL